MGSPEPAPTQLENHQFVVETIKPCGEQQHADTRSFAAPSPQNHRLPGTIAANCCAPPMEPFNAAANHRLSINCLPDPAAADHADTPAPPSNVDLDSNATPTTVINADNEVDKQRGSVSSNRGSEIVIRKFQKLDETLLSSTPAPDVKIGQRVAYKEYYGNEFGTIRWIGELPASLRSPHKSPHH